MFSSLRSRLWLSYALLIVTALSVMATALGVYLWRNPLLYRQSLARLRVVETALAKWQGTNDFGMSFPVAMERAAAAFDMRLLLFDIDGNLLKDTNPEDAILGLPRPTLFNRQLPTVRDANGKNWLYTAQTLNDGTTLMVVIPRPRVALVTIFRDELMPVFMGGGSIALLLSLVLAFIVARWVADPLQRIIATSQHVPVGETKPVSEHGPREVRELARAFNEMIARMQSSQRAQRDFVANVSHELKTPLTSVQGFAQAIIDGTAGTPAKQKQAAEIIYAEAGRMHRMVLDLLDLARLDAGIADLKMAAVDVRVLLDGIAEKFSPQAQKAEVDLLVDTPSYLPPLLADGDRLAQVLTNLVDNALKYTPIGGQVSLQAQVDQAGMEICVADTGVGIPEEALAQIFDRFYQADRSRPGGEKQGAGLGLAIAQEIAIAHGGRITVRSQKGLGTTFYVRLPLSGLSARTMVKRK